MSNRYTASATCAVLALARARAESGSPEPLSLVVDLAAEPIGATWARGAATLAMLCAVALAFTPGLDPFSPALARTIAPSAQVQINPMLGGEDRPGSRSEIPLDPVAAAKPVTVSEGNQVRVRGAVTEGLYWSLRDAGVSPQVAADYLHALSTRIDVGAEVAPFDRFDLVMSRAPGQPLLYAALHRVDGPDVELMKWNQAGRAGWFDTDASSEQRASGLMAPVAGRITSNFGIRYHPILHFARLHAGIDFGASWGSPIVAAADGQIVGAGWAGGYGRQVRVAHARGIVTTYSHMSGIAASPGQMVRQGQVIGYVGSSGLSTGPHLHFEVLVNGQPVNPMTVRMQQRSTVSGPERQAFNARLKQLLSIGQRA